ncbi:uncharacterized protein TNCT_37711 [Trichonephila clavata]|uniref:Uncharacterized protein n=1 Tax=Trichonephila clavata TaxID=2740835 RepID=A0A8X6HAB8_TRICU|nr:uncharacterized protein TNCT_37711 [Trichonephila clavata]
MFSQHCLRRTIYWISAPSTSETGNSHWVPNLVRVGVTADFPPEPYQTILVLLGPGIAMKEDNTITKHARPFASDSFAQPCQSGTAPGNRSG